MFGDEGKSCGASDAVIADSIPTLCSMSAPLLEEQKSSRSAEVDGPKPGTSSEVYSLDFASEQRQHLFRPVSSTSSEIGWSISSPHTMTSCTLTQTPQVADVPEPEIDFIDGQSFMSFDTLDDILTFTKRNESVKVRDQQDSNTALEAVASTSRLPEQSAAFVSPVLNEFLKKTREELKRSVSGIVCPPRDSRIFETGALKMDVARKPFADLPKLPPVRVPVVPVPTPRPRCTGVENDPIITKPADVLPVKRKKPSPDFDASKMTTDDFEKCYTKLMHESAKHLALSRVSRHVSFKMDDAYAKFALEALNPTSAASVSPPPPEKPGKKWKRKSSELDSPTGKSVKESDVVAMISRKRDGAKRDIRLPSRYQESALIEGKDLICPAPFGSSAETHACERKSRKRLLDEQKRLAVLKFPTRELSPSMSSDNPPEKSRIPAAKRKRPVIKIENSGTKAIPTISNGPATMQTTNGSSIPRSTGQFVAPAPIRNKSKISVAGSNVLSQPPVLKTPLIRERVPVSDGSKSLYKELYRELFYACHPDKRVECQQNRVKPRVHKQQAVDRAVDIIKRLKLQERQFLYIKKLLMLWNKKLDLCSKVITNRVSPEPNPEKDTVSVVRNVLKAYQQSVGYKVSENMEKRGVNELLGPTLFPANMSIKSEPHEAGDNKQVDQIIQPVPSSNTPVVLKKNVNAKPKGVKREPKFRSQSLLLSKNHATHSSSTSRSPAGQNNGMKNKMSNVSSDLKIVDINENANDVVVDGKITGKQFIWSNNKMMSSKEIPMNGTGPTFPTHRS